MPDAIFLRPNFTSGEHKYDSNKAGQIAAEQAILNRARSRLRNGCSTPATSASRLPTTSERSTCRRGDGRDAWTAGAKPAWTPSAEPERNRLRTQCPKDDLASQLRRKLQDASVVSNAMMHGNYMKLTKKNNEYIPNGSLKRYVLKKLFYTQNHLFDRSTCSKRSYK